METGSDRSRLAVPYVDLAKQNSSVKDEILAAVEKVLESGQFILGAEVREFEEAIAQRLGVAHVLGVSNGTDALILALRALEIGPGDEVITVSHSFVATALAIRLVGATPVFVDIEDDSMMIDPSEVEAAMSPRTRAVMPVHLNGFACRVGELAELCRRHEVTLIEDCAQALGAMHAGRPTGSFGVGCFSLHPLKPLSACGDAGLVSTDDAALAEKVARLRNLGLRDRDHCEDITGNHRLDTLQAAILLAKHAHFDDYIAARRERAAVYRRELAGKVRLPPDEGDDFATYSTFVIRHPRRDRLQRAMIDRGVSVNAHYPLGIHQQGAFADLASCPLPVTERVVSEILSLPVTPELDPAEQEAVIGALLDSLAEIGE